MTATLLQKRKRSEGEAVPSGAFRKGSHRGLHRFHRFLAQNNQPRGHCEVPKNAPVIFGASMTRVEVSEGQPQIAQSFTDLFRKEQLFHTVIVRSLKTRA
jgi:hypothetical protein